MRYCLDRQLRLNMMIAGNGELDTYLDQLESLGRPLHTDNRPWIVQHAAIAEPDQIKRLAALDVDLTTTMSFSWGKGELFAQRVGEQVLDHLVPLQRLLDAGIRVGCGTDWGPKNVFEHIALAVEPRYGASGRRATTPGIARMDALAMWTRRAAEVLAWNDIGTIAPGAHADLVIVDRNPLTCPTSDIAGTRDTDHSARRPAHQPLPERYLAQRIPAVDVEPSARSQRVADALASTAFQLGMTSVQRADADREREVEQVLALTEFELFDRGDAERQVRRVGAKRGCLRDRARRTVDAQHVSGTDPGSDLTRGSAWPATDLKNPQPRFQRQRLHDRLQACGQHSISPPLPRPPMPPPR